LFILCLCYLWLYCLIS